MSQRLLASSIAPRCVWRVPCLLLSESAPSDASHCGKPAFAQWTRVVRRSRCGTCSGTTFGLQFRAVLVHAYQANSTVEVLFDDVARHVGDGGPMQSRERMQVIARALSDHGFQHDIMLPNHACHF